MAPAEFLREYWQKRPLLIRNAFPGFVSPISPEDLAGLPVRTPRCRGSWRMKGPHRLQAATAGFLRHGPFPEEMFPTLPQHDWTLLVQDVDKWDADVAGLFAGVLVPSALAHRRHHGVVRSAGGSVGAHVDQYDVFLLQAQGRRRWQIDTTPDPPIHYRLDTELKLLQRFTPTHDWVLGPGDMLYLPPGVPHHGVAEDACLTFSIGMRAPAAAELLGDFVDTLIEGADDAQRYRDPDLQPTSDPNEIDAAAMQRVVEALNALRMNDPGRLGDWFGRFITLYRSGGGAVPGTTPPRIEFEWALEHGARLLRHPLVPDGLAQGRSQCTVVRRRAGHGHAGTRRATFGGRHGSRCRAVCIALPARTGCRVRLARRRHYQLPTDEEA